MEKKKEKKEIKQMTALSFASIVGLDKYAKFFCEKKYKSELDTLDNWVKKITKDGLIIDMDKVNKLKK